MLTVESFELQISLRRRLFLRSPANTTIAASRYQMEHPLGLTLAARRYHILRSPLGGMTTVGGHCCGQPLQITGRCQPQEAARVVYTERYRVCLPIFCDLAPGNVEAASAQIRGSHGPTCGRSRSDLEMVPRPCEGTGQIMRRSRYNLEPTPGHA